MQVVTTNPLFFWLLATSTSILTTFGMNMVSSTHSLLSPARARGVWGAPALAPNCLGLAPPLTSWPNLLSRSPRVLSPRHRSTPPSGRDCWHGVDAGTHFYAGLAYAIICCSHPHLFCEFAASVWAFYALATFSPHLGSPLALTHVMLGLFGLTHSLVLILSHGSSGHHPSALVRLALAASGLKVHTD
jgi:hypothetical protein